MNTSSPIPWPLKASLLTTLFLVVGCGGGGSGCPPLSTDLRLFEPGTPLDRSIDAGESHGYRIPLTAGELLEVTVEQVGADVTVVLREASGCPLVNADSPNGPRGPEQLFAVAGEEGGYVLEVERPSRYGSDPGSYTLEIARRTPTPRDLLRAKASRLRAAGGPTVEGLEALEEAARLWEQTGESYLEAATRLQIALGQWNRGSIDEALESFLEAEARIRAVGGSELVPALLNARGDTLRALGELVAAQGALDQAVVTSQALGNRWQEAAALANLSWLYRDRREPWVALGFSDLSLDLFEALGDAGEKAHGLHNRGALLNWLGRERMAAEVLGAALEIRREQGVRTEIAESLRELGWVEFSLGDREKGERRIEKALEIYREEGDGFGEAVCRDRLGRIYLETGRPEEARDSHLLAIGGFRESGDEPGEAHARNNLGRALRELGELEEARAAHEGALRLFQALEEPSGGAYALADLARVRRLEGDLHGALEDAEAALGLLEGIRENARSPNFRAYYLATVHEHYELTIDLAMELATREPHHGWETRAFEVAERSRARTLLELLSNLEGERKRYQVPDTLRVQRDALVRAIRSEMREVQKLEARGAVASELETATRHLNDLMLERDYQEGSRFGAGEIQAGTPRSLPEIRDMLAPGISLLTFSLGERRSFVWLLGPEGLSARELPPRDEIRAAVEGVLEDVTRQDGILFGREDLNPHLDRLGEMLLSSLPKEALTRRLVVVPDDILHRLPFAALRLAGRHLVQDHEILRVPSASVLVTLRERKHEHTEPSKVLALMADPVFQRDDERLSGVPAVEASVARFDTPPIVEDLGRLPASGSEADTIANQVDPTCRWTPRGFEASREPVDRGHLAGYHLIHFATHAVRDDERPETSGIVLSGFDEQGRSREGYLYAFEIAELELTADLVVLSACSTGLGHEIRGEGLVGLTQSFLEAGADRVLVSLWNVDDTATAELMGHFYRGLLRDRLPPAEALRRAQERLRLGETWSDPYYWAGFTLVGSSGELPSTLLTSPCLHR